MVIIIEGSICISIPVVFAKVLFITSSLYGYPIGNARTNGIKYGERALMLPSLRHDRKTVEGECVLPHRLALYGCPQCPDDLAFGR